MRLKDKPLKAALDAIKATPLQRNMAAILFVVNDKESALRFVEMVAHEKKMKKV